MSSSRGRTAHSSPPIGSKRGESSSVSRSKKKQKRLEDICDSPVSLAVRGSADETGDAGALRRSTRARKVTVFPDFSPEPFYPKIGKSGTRGGNVSGGGRLRRGAKNAVAVDVEIAPMPEADKVGAADGSSDGEEASNYRSIRSSMLAEGQSGASAAFKKLSFANLNEQNEEEDRSLKPGECVVENQGASTVESNRKMKRRRKIKRRNPGKRNQIPQVPTDYEENRLHECPLREQEISASPSDDNDENHKNTILKEDNREDEDQSQDRSEGVECGTSTHEKSFAEDDNQLASELPSSTAECKFYSRRTTSTRTRVTTEEAPLESENQATLGEDLLKFGRNAPTSSSDEDFAEEKDETSTEKASPKEDDRIIKEIVSPAGDSLPENGSGKFNPLDGEATERTPCQLENGFIENHAGIPMGRSETNLPESHSSRVREGRRCGLCGGGNDGKPAKKLILASAESDNEQYNGTSSSEEPTYDVWDGFGEESDWLGKLLGPIRDRLGIARVWVHQQCAVWSPEVYFAGLGRLKNVRAALCRGRALKCSRCGRPGATIGCRVDRCPKTYHLPCARAENSIFDHRKFLIGCSDHRHLFQPQGIRYLQRIKKIKTRKMKSDLKKLSHEASRKDLEAEEKWLENCGEDEEFLKREGKRLHRDMQRIAPVFIGGDSSGSDTSAFKGWESVAGLNDVIRCLKEVVILPLLYPEVFTSLALSPPRGVLLHGYPGTGKTHVVRALIGECARGDKRIAYFARKGADCLGKYVGDAERQLRLLFQVAEKSQPSIIFFDEIDGLAPCRSKRQDQTHNSVVATLLSLLDGLKSRGSVVVIGATNRPDSVDPALRRPGRFDREIYFPLPSVNDRSTILSLQTKNWPKPLSGSLLSWISKQTAGFAGADLQALCTQAAMIALKRNFPLHEILLTAEKGSGNGKKPPLPLFSVLERDWHSALASAPPPCSRREAGMAANEVITAPLPSHLVPCLLLPLCYLLISFYFEERMWVPPPLLEAAKSVKDVIFAALQQMRKPVTSWKYHLPCLFQKENIAQEIERHLSYVGLLGCTSTPVPLQDNSDDFERSKLHGHRFSKPNISFGLQKSSGFRVLITGNQRSGQRHLAACLLDQFLGHIDIQKVNLSTLSQEGRGDIILGINQILSRCMSGGWCIVYMPRLDLWAVDEVAIEDQNSRESSGRGDLGKTAIRSSSAWDSFVEHMNSMCGSSSLIVLATCEMTRDDIPARVRGFFTTVDMNDRNAATSEHTIPRFFVQVDGIVDRSVAIASSVSRIACDVIKEYIQFLHRRSHASNIHHGMKVLRETKFSKVSNGQGKVGEASPKVDQSQHIEQNVIISRSPLSRNMKGSSTVMISALGYQILQYPQFAELCWSTSKVKGGPCADVSGPWKIWPFNSCIIRPHESADKSMLPSISRNSKNKEISGLVRGLVAVGLLAYRGSYSSVREVSSQVRIVLELLVELICEKIQRGKNSYRYSRILSQVAYMEDLVNSWAYAFLRSSLKIDEDSYAPTSCGPHGNEVAEETQGKNGELVKNADSDTPKVDHIVDPNVDHSADQEISTAALTKPVDSEQSDGNLKELTSFESLCVYACCSDCFQLVNASVQEIVTRCWEAGRCSPTVDRFHDIVTLCSLNLVSAVRKHFLSLDDGEFFPGECNRHSSVDSGSMPGLKLLFRDGILLASDPPEGAEVHCSLGRLCLHSVYELVVKSLRVNEAGSW